MSVSRRGAESAEKRKGEDRSRAGHAARRVKTRIISRIHKCVNSVMCEKRPSVWLGQLGYSSKKTSPPGPHCDSKEMEKEAIDTKPSFVARRRYPMQIFSNSECQYRAKCVNQPPARPPSLSSRKMLQSQNKIYEIEEYDDKSVQKELLQLAASKTNLEKRYISEKGRGFIPESRAAGSAPSRRSWPRCAPRTSRPASCRCHRRSRRARAAAASGRA